jgi:acyl-CoA synthetase (AMP-forming)/AMP-acid ligase II
MKKLGTPDIPYESGEDTLSQFKQAARERANETAVVYLGRSVSWKVLLARINQVADTLLSLGVAKGSRVAILSRNSIEYIEVFFGALTAGACAVPLPSMASTDALKLMIEDSRPKVLAVSEEMKKLVEPFVNELDCLVDDGAIGLDFNDDEWTAYGAWIEGSSEEDPNVAIDKDDEFNIIYSSGTTGVPKGIVHSHAVRKVFVEGLRETFSAPGMVCIISTPLYSNTTMVSWLSSMRSGTTMVLMKKFNTREFLELWEKHRATLAMLVPVQYDRILRVEDLDSFDLSSMQVKYSTSAPLHAGLKRQILDRLPGELIEYYGLTEGGVGTRFVGSEHGHKLDSVGVVGDGCEVKVIDEQGNELPAGQAGELVGRRPGMMNGYLNRQDATREMLWYDKDGRLFFRSGDIGRFDEEGLLYISGRKKEVIISGGFNIFAVDLEYELLKHEAVAEAAVIGIPSEQWGETPLALVVPEKDTNETPESILDWVNARLGKGQRISQVEFRDELPKSSIGKTLKKELRRPYWDRPTAQGEAAGT